MSDYLNTPLEFSPEGACLKSAHATIEALCLPAISKIEMRKRLSALDARPAEDFPLVMVSSASKVMPADAGTNERDDVQYAVMVAIVAAANRDDSIDTAGWLLYCEWLIERAFHHKVAADLAACSLPEGVVLLYTTAEPGAQFVDAAFRQNFDATWLLLRFHTRQARA